MAKIFSILTLLIAGVAAYLGFETQKRVTYLQEKGLESYQKLEITKGVLKETRDRLTETYIDRDNERSIKERTQKQLAETQDTLQKTQTELAQVKAERDAARVAFEQMKTAIEAALPPGMKIEEIAKLAEAVQDMANKVKELELANTTLNTEKANLLTKVANLESDVDRMQKKMDHQTVVIDKYTKHKMQRGLRGRVLAVNAGWGFCVVSIGDKQGAADGRILVVARNGQAIGKVKISTIEATQSIADIIPSSFSRNVFIQPGDEVIYTGDDTIDPEAEIARTAAAVRPELPR